MALPAMKDKREALQLPASGTSEVSSFTTATRSYDRPRVSAATWPIAPKVPCPTSEMPILMMAFSLAWSPYNSHLAVHLSGKPKL